MADNYLISVYSADSSEIGKDEDVELLWKEDLTTYVLEFDDSLTVEDFLKKIKTDIAGDPESHGDLIMDLYFGADNYNEDNFSISTSSISYLIGTIEKVEPDGSLTPLYKFRNIPLDLIMEIRDNDDWETWSDFFLNYRANFKFELYNSSVILSAQDATLQDLKDIGEGTFKSFDWISVEDGGILEDYLTKFIDCLLR